MNIANKIRVSALIAAILVVLSSPSLTEAQNLPPAGVDSLRSDSLRPQRLPASRVEVTRTEGVLSRLPWAVGQLTATDIRRGQATMGIDEALNGIPGVVIANRYNYAVDQRLSVRGAGSRSNFGFRGVKVLLDGIPQSLPDGQGQLTNLDLSAISGVEVLRGAASSLYGNGSGGVIAFTTDLSSPDRLGASARFTGGSFGLSKLQTRVSGRSGNTVGMLSASRATLDGSRQHSSADVRQLMGAVDHQLPSGIRFSLRGGSADTPHSLNPGALTPEEFAANPDSAAPNNVSRGAGKSVSQHYLSLQARHESDRRTWSTSLYGQWRDLSNPLAAPPPGVVGPVPADAGTVITLDRSVYGARVDGRWALGTSAPSSVSAGIDLQRANDLRRNQRTTAGRPTGPADTLLILQREVMTSIGPFAQVQIDPHRDLTVSAGGRWDRIGFSVDDRFMNDGADNSASRAMTATTGHVGLVWRVSALTTLYSNLSSSFETPTTTELAVRPDGAGGFNPDLEPQKIRTLEVGGRGSIHTRLSYDLAVFESNTTDALVQYMETGARAYFRNAGRTRQRGIELGLTARLTDWADLRAAWTHADYRFVEYRVPGATPAAVDTLDGNELGGVPRNVLRLALRTEWRGFALDADHTIQGAMWSDDANTPAIRAKGWGDGQLNIRASWSGELAGRRVEPFLGVQNALDLTYVSSVTLNGTFRRVLEPAPGRNWYAGMEVGTAILR